MRKAVLLGAVALLATAGLARAADMPSAVEIRKIGMGLEGSVLFLFQTALNAKVDVKTLEHPATAMLLWAKTVPRLFPKGSETGDGTNAKPDIWSDSEGFAKAAAREADEVGKLVALTKAGDADAVAVQLKAVVAACSACHNAYKAK
jgi:hypothetical protein